MKRSILKNIDYCLNNETGAPNVETVGIIAVSLAVGVGLFIFGKYEANWFETKPTPTIDGIKLPDDNAFDGWRDQC